jgi:hypothetical protein
MYVAQEMAMKPVCRPTTSLSLLALLGCCAAPAEDSPAPPPSPPPIVEPEDRITLGTYPAVGAGDLAGHTCTFRTGSHREDSFLWSFTADGFTLAGDRLPPELCAALGVGAHGKVEGTWTFASNGIELRADGAGRACVVPIMRTGPTILRLTIGDDQYVCTR